MDRKTAFEILGLKEDATQDEIVKRMDVLYRKFKNIERDERGYTLSDIDEAYKIVCGITYIDEKAEAEKRYRQEHPNPIFKLLGIDEEKARNIIHYYKWHAIIALVAIIAVISIIVSIVNKTEPDLKVIVAGDIFVYDTAKLEERIKDEIEGVEEALVQNISLSDNFDAQFQAAMQTKFVVEISAGKNDIFILDEEKFFELARQGAFLPVEEVLGDLDALGIDENKYEDLILTAESISTKPDIYGIDVTDSKLLKEMELVGDRFIAAFGYSAENLDNAAEFMKLIVK
ncbi:MAG: hypothetical protein GXX10_10255 [Clostridiaceae bacterium]|nr:hypothetical protein [Clostridiaceae bacterium]